MVTSQPGRLWRHAQWVAGSCLWLENRPLKVTWPRKWFRNMEELSLGWSLNVDLKISWQLVFLYPGIPLYVKYPGSSVLLTSHVRPASPHLKLPLEECSLQEIMRTMKMMVGAWESLPCRRHGHGFQWMKRRQSFQALATYDNLQAFWLVI